MLKMAEVATNKHANSALKVDNYKNSTILAILNAFGDEDNFERCHGKIEGLALVVSLG